MPLLEIYEYVPVYGTFASCHCWEYLGIYAIVWATYNYVVIRILVVYTIVGIVLGICDLILGEYVPIDGLHLSRASIEKYLERIRH